MNGNQLIVNTFFLSIAHTLADFILHRVFRIVEFTDTTAQSTHELGDFFAAKQQYNYEKNQNDLGTAQLAEK